MARRSEKSDTAFRTIGEAAETLGIPQHVLRFWETRFPQIQPLKRGGGRRYYRPTDMVVLETIRAMLHDEGLTIRGAQQALSQRKTVSSTVPPAASAPVALATAPAAAPAVVLAVAPPPLSPAARQMLVSLRDRLAVALAA